MMALLTGAASAAAAIVAVAHNGSTGANWLPICQQYRSFCGRISGSLIGSFISIIVLVLIIIVTSVAISRRWLIIYHVFVKLTFIWWKKNKKNIQSLNFTPQKLKLFVLLVLLCFHQIICVLRSHFLHTTKIYGKKKKPHNSEMETNLCI